jgi:ABC-type branched-subunit amino acid transport system permease subunit
VSLFVENLAPALILALLALSLNLQYGVTGLLNFGQGFFYALGGYTVGVVYFHHWPGWIAVVGGPIVGAIGGLLLAAGAIRLTGDFWALMTLGVAALFVAVVTNWGSLAGGVLGSYEIPRANIGRLDVYLGITIVVCFLLFERIRRSQLGRLLRIAREDPVLVAALGRNVLFLRAKVLALGGAVAAIAGVALAYWLSVIAPTVFTLDQTILVWTALILGGRGNNLGAIVGGLAMESLVTYLPYLPGFDSVVSNTNWGPAQLIIEAAILVGFLMVRREGILPEWRVLHGSTRRTAVARLRGVRFSSQS